MKHPFRLPKYLVWTAVAALALLTGLAVGRFQFDDRAAQGGADGATVLAQPRPLPDVELIDGNGAPFARGGFEGQWDVLFFGFTHCPDICPNTLGLLATVREQLAAEGEGHPPRVVFVSVDPRRDTPARLDEYLAYFDESFVGVTGTRPQIDRLTEALYLPYNYVGDVDSGDYTVDHSGALVVVDPQGRAVAYITPPLEFDMLVSELRRLTDAT